jgi:hypothetical protein
VILCMDGTGEWQQNLTKMTGDAHEHECRRLCGEVPVGPSILNCDGDDQNDGGPPEMGRETLAWFVSMVSNE